MKLEKTAMISGRLHTSASQFEQGLNPAQLAAVVHGEGPMLVLAGAGSGKTRVITHRIARLLALGIPAQAIVAVTFTNKAAGEMLERIESLAGARTTRGLTISTFHSFGLMLLQKESRYLGFGGGFTVFDQSDSVGTIRELLRTLNIDGGRRVDTSAILNRISLAKNAFQTPETMPDGGDLDGDAALYQQLAKLLYEKYIAALRGFHALDFDDLVCEPVRLLKQFAELRERWQKQYRFILVDEYQDTNRAQLELLRLLVGEHKNLTVVGDDDQSIYAWRGADVTNILSFEEHFQGAKIVKLEQNYRSTKPILDAANAVVTATSAKKYKKTLFTDRVGGDLIQHVACALPEVEASFVATEIRKLVTSGVAPNAIAVMYRSNKQSALIEEALRERSIAYTLVGGQSFYEKKEVKDLLAYIRLVMNPHDEISLRRVINYPTRGIGEQAFSRLEGFSITKDIALFQAVERASEVPDLTPAARAGCAQLANIIRTAKDELKKERPASQIARQIAESIQLREDLQEATPSGKSAEKRWGNIENFIRSLERFESRTEANAWDPDARRTPSLSEYLHRLTLKFGSEEEESHALVTLTTLHGAKGLEYDYVFLIGLEEGILPHKRITDPRAIDVVEFKTNAETGEATLDDSGLDEERRLFYVGVTRARKRLYLCRARARQQRAQVVTRTPSRFLYDIPKELCEMREITELQKLDVAQLAQRTQSALANFATRPRF